MTRGRREKARAPVVLLALFALAFASAPARGALFDDDEARQRVDQIEQRLSSLESTLKSQGLVDLLHDVEQLKADVATLRGQQEVLTYELEQAQKRSRD